MTAPCDLDPRLVSTQDGKFFRLDYFASPEACVYFEDESDWTSESIAEVRITNTSKQPLTIFTSSGGSLRPKFTFEVDLPDRISEWRRGPPSGKSPEQVEAILLPNMVWTSNAARIFNPMAALAVKNHRPIRGGFVPMELDKPRMFVVSTRFYANIKHDGTEQVIDVELRSTLAISHVPEPEDAVEEN